MWVVIDGLDRSFSDGADAAVAQLARAIEPDGTLGLGLLLTSQQQEWSRLVNRLAERNAIVTWKTLPVDTFTDEELTRVLDEFPALRGVVLRGRLTGVLRNPKVLDVVLRRPRGGDLAGDEVLRGQESRFAEWFYERLVCGNGPGRAGRGSLAMHLAGLHADTLQPETPLVDLDPAALDHLESLERDGVCEQQDGRVRFAHDLYGDWVRHRLLRVHEHDPPEYVRSRLQSPLWHRAIRLHALEQLAEHDAGGWQAEMQRLGGEQPGVLHDLFLEAPLFAEDATASLEKVWPILVEGEGLLLRRLLTRFQHIATIPNPVVLERMRDLDEDLQTHIATMNRVPYWPLWMSLPQVLRTHQSEARALAPDELARTADMWLRWTPPEWPLRGEAADLAIGLGRDMLERIRQRAYGAEDRERRVWSAVLAAVTERREDMVQITDALTGRGAEPHEADEDELADDLDEDDWTPGDSRRRRPGVDRTFREHCLEGDALHPVIGADPALAGEILFAILAPRPVRQLRFGMGMPGEELGPERMPGWFFPFYTPRAVPHVLHQRPRRRARAHAAARRGDHRPLGANASPRRRVADERRDLAGRWIDPHPARRRAGAAVVPRGLARPDDAREAADGAREVALRRGRRRSRHRARDRAAARREHLRGDRGAAHWRRLPSPRTLQRAAFAAADRSRALRLGLALQATRAESPAHRALQRAADGAAARSRVVQPPAPQSAA